MVASAGPCPRDSLNAAPARATPRCDASLRLGGALARPCAGQAGERVARSMLGQTAHQSEQRAFERERKRELADRRGTLLRLRRLRVVDDAPEALKQLLADQPRGDPRDDAERPEQELAHTRNLPVFRRRPVDRRRSRERSRERVMAIGWRALQASRARRTARSPATRPITSARLAATRR